ncbi:hypothetical protein [Escherichia coli]|uniref:hypothetical protein n=1 Tax=Escherichia coli TaxID=562 RepID=UPI0039890FB6
MDPAVQRPLRQTRTRKPFPESLPVTKSDCCQRRRAARNCGGSLSYLGEDTGRTAGVDGVAPSGYPDGTGKTLPVLSAMPSCRHLHLRGPSSGGYRRTGLLARVLTSKYAEHTPLYRQSEYTAGKVWS